MRGAISKSGVMPRWPADKGNAGGQGVHREVGSEGHEEKQRAVVDKKDEPVGQRWGKVEPALWRRRRYSCTHRTKVCADGTLRKIYALPREGSSGS